MSNIRVFIDVDFDDILIIKSSDKRYHYISNVMRSKIGDKIKFINGKDGEFLYNIKNITKKEIIFEKIEKIKDFFNQDFLGLIFAPIQKIDLLVKGATEIGVTDFFPVNTEYTSKINLKLIDKINKNIIEAVEQSERVDLPKVNNIQFLKDILVKLNNDKNIVFFCEERTSSNSMLNVYNNCKNKIKDKKIYALIGAEGGFSYEEKKLINSFDNVISVNLGDTILRSETATISILTLLKLFKQ